MSLSLFGAKGNAECLHPSIRWWIPFQPKAENNMKMECKLSCSPIYRYPIVLDNSEDWMGLYGVPTWHTFIALFHHCARDMTASTLLSQSELSNLFRVSFPSWYTLFPFRTANNKELTRAPKLFHLLHKVMSEEYSRKALKSSWKTQNFKD